MLSGPFHLVTVPLKASSILAFVPGVRAYGGIIDHLVVVNFRLPFLLMFSTYTISAYFPHAADVFNGCSRRVGCHLVPCLC
jgi:hypothetical protein